MNKIMLKKIDAILASIDRETAPPMSRTDAVEFLETVSSYIDSRVDCLREEIESEE